MRLHAVFCFLETACVCSSKLGKLSDGSRYTVKQRDRLCDQETQAEDLTLTTTNMVSTRCISKLMTIDFSNNCGSRMRTLSAFNQSSQIGS
jgi:hypothetical protein